MSAPGESSSDDDDFQFESSHVGSKRYPVHDCCEFEDAESLRRLIFVPQGASDEDDNDEGGSSDEDDDDSSGSSSDDNDSHAAARDAAIGHSPKPIAKIASNAVGATAAAAAGLTDSKVPESIEAQGSGSEETEKLTSQESGITTNEVSPSSAEGGADSSQDNEATIESPSRKEGDAKDAESGLPPESENQQEPSSAKEATTPISATGMPSAGDDNDEKAQPISSQEAEAEANGDGGTSTAKDAVMEEAESHPSRAENGRHTNSDTTKPKKAKKKAKARKTTYYCPYDLNERDEDENTPLHVAIHACKLQHVRLLLEAGANLQKRCDGSFPVHTAISMGALPQHADFAHDCVALLLGHGADLSSKDDSVHTPLYLATTMNLPRVVSLILSDSVGISTLNARADRLGGRALHAAAKFDVQSIPAVSRSPSLSGKQLRPGDAAATGSTNQGSQAPSTVTEFLLATTGIDVDAQNVQGQTALHTACSRGNWHVVRLLLRAGANPAITDRRALTPGQQAQKRGMPIPNDLLAVLEEGAPTNHHMTPPRDLIVDPDSTTFLICHELCLLHRSCPPIRRDTVMDPPPENVRRLQVLINEDSGILRSGEFVRMIWEGEARRAAIGDVLKVHEYNYVESISQICSSIPDHPSAIAHLDGDTAVSRWSFEAAMRAAGSVCEAVDRVVNGDHRNAFCAVRPPGHHAGPRGIVRCANDPDGGSHGFCLLNNVAIGAAYARSMYRNDGIRKIAIVDFDVHHGNGTEAIIRQLVPTVEKSVVRTPFAAGELTSQTYRPWLDETDVNDVLFCSTHGYGPRGLDDADSPQQCGWFYPASGKTVVSDAVANPSVVESPNVGDFILSQTWTRMGEETQMNCCKIVNCGLSIPSRDAVPGWQRLELRDTYRKTIFPRLREFDPDIIFVSAGFDAHKKDSMNFGYVGMVEDDYEWVTEGLIKIANSCCNGRIVSVLEGGYKIHGGIVSPFARSVASHVRALVDGGRSRELFDGSDYDWESKFERQILEDRERKRQQKQERQHRAMELAWRQQEHQQGQGLQGEGGEPVRKRRRQQVDYKLLYEKMFLAN